MPSNWPTMETAEDFFRQTTRRLDRNERRAAPVAAAALMGPGMSAQAIRLVDWNDEISTFNGFFWTQAGALNAPVIEVYDLDPDTGMPVGTPVVLPPMDWSGMTVARDDGTGSQHIWNTDQPEMMYSRVRNYWPNPDDPSAPVVFGEWMRWATSTGFVEGEDLAPEVQEGIQGAYDTAVEALEAAVEAIGLIPPENWVFRQPTAPVSTPEHTLIAGDFWFDTDSVPPNQMWTYNGSAWVDPASAILAGGATASQAAAAAAQNALAVANTAVGLAEDASQQFWQDAEPTPGPFPLGSTWHDTNDGNKTYRWNSSAWVPGITAWLQTNAGATQGLKVTTAGLTAYADGSAPGVPAGTPTFSITASTGAVAMLGSLTSGSTVSGATVTGGTLQTSGSPSVGVKITSTGLVAYGGGAAQTTINASTGLFSTSGGGFFGGNVSGSSVTADSGGVIQTESTFNRGIKMNSAGLVAYAGAGAVWPITPGQATFSITANTGAVAMLGNLTSGSTITGASITGGTLQTAISGLRAVIETSGGVGMFSVYNDGTRLGDLRGGSFLGSPTMSLSSASGGAIWVGNNYIALFASTVEVNGALEVKGDLDMNSHSISGAYGISAVGVNAFELTSTGKVNANNGFYDTALVGGGITGANINDNGKIYRAPPSSRRFKQDIEPLRITREAWRALKGVSFRYKDAEKHGGGRHIGLLAEDLVEAGLDEFVIRDGSGEIAGIHYDRLALVLVPALADLVGRTELLEARLAAAGI